MVCSQCGTNNAQDDLVRKMIPHNTYALISYYVGIICLLCLWPGGIAAIIFGIMGIKYANENVEAKGKIHAWVGIVLGVLEVILCVIAIISFLGQH